MSDLIDAIDHCGAIRNRMEVLELAIAALPDSDDATALHNFAGSLVGELRALSEELGAVLEAARKEPAALSG